MWGGNAAAPDGTQALRMPAIRKHFTSSAAPSIFWPEVSTQPATLLVLLEFVFVFCLITISGLAGPDWQRNVAMSLC